MADISEYAALDTPETTTADKPTAVSAAVAESTNKFQHAISAWRNIDLTTLVSTLDNTASDIVAYQRDSTVQRKDLAQKTKDFRKMDDSTKLTEIKALLKAYQTFIDLLTNHSKSTNSAFLQVYSALSDAPDPYPLLEASVDSMLVSEDTLPKLTEENQHLQKNITKLTSQLEDTETKLQSESTARKQLETNLDSKVKEVEVSWTAVLEEKKDNWEAKEKALEEKVENQERLMTEIKASYEVNQRLKGSGDGDSETHGGHVTSAELEMVHSDLERTSARLAEVEARNEQLRLDLAQSKSQVTTQAPALEDDPGYMRMRSENSSLIRKLDSSRIEKESFKRDIDTKLRGLEREIGLLKEDRDSLRAKVQKWHDYDDVKQELEVLKSIEFATGDDDDALIAEADSNGSTTRGKGDTLEQLLLARNKKLSDELTILRVSHQDLQSRLENLQEDMSRTNADLERSQNLNTQLENDLANLQAEGQNAFPSGASVAGTYARYAPSLAPGRRGGRTSPTSSIISGFNPRDAGGDVYGGGSGMLPMITAQRDRFKQRITQLENELSDSHRTISQLRSETAALQKDNLQLYEKTRYVSTYNRGAPSASSSSAYSSNPNPSTVAMGGTGNPGISLDRYRKAYESNISPFAAFRGRESARAYKKMSLPERVVYSVTRMVLASRTSRNLFAAYCVALHLLVFLSLYWMGTTDAEQHASSLSHGVAGAAALAGAAGKAGTGSSHGDWKEDSGGF